MLIVLAHREDRHAATLVARWKGLPAALLTCQDLSMKGWYYRVGDVGQGVAVASGRTIDVNGIRGVLVRLSRVAPGDLSHFVPYDRAYVASEMTAFLAAWLNQLNCPVLNRPSPLCLLGPAWSPQQWTHAAAQLGIPVAVATRELRCRRQARFHVAPMAHVTVVGERCFGAVEEPLALAAARLARRAKVDLLRLYFSGPTAGARFMGATLRPDLETEEEITAVLDYLGRESAPRSQAA